MIITSLSLTDFRNYSEHTFEFSPKTSIILGRNTAGKTNLLESIFLLATGRSFKAGSDKEMIAFGKELSRVKAIIEQFMESEAVELETVITTGQVINIKTPYKKHLINGVGKRILIFCCVCKSFDNILLYRGIVS